MNPYILKYDNTDGGSQLGPLIRINKKYKDDKGLLAHEVEHVRQWWITSLLSLPLFLYVVPAEWWLPLCWLPFFVYHLLCEIPVVQKYVEVQCWRKQLSMYPDDRSLQAALHLSTMYGFKMTYNEALKLLRS